MNRPLTRQMFHRYRPEILSRGRWANADLFLCRLPEGNWVIKDFFSCPPLVRRTWGRWMVRREYRALVRLRGIAGIPSEPFALDAYAVGYRFIAGKTLRDTLLADVPEDFFYRLETLVRQMHERGIVHLDIRNRRNILVMETGGPALLDFQTSLDLHHVPGFLHPLLKDIDLSGVYKNWANIRPGQMGRKRLAHLEALNRKRAFWMFKGYPRIIKGRRRD